VNSLVSDGGSGWVTGKMNPANETAGLPLHTAINGHRSRGEPKAAAVWSRTHQILTPIASGRAWNLCLLTFVMNSVADLDSSRLRFIQLIHP